MLKPDNNKRLIHAVCYVLQAYSVVLCEWNERRYGIGKLVFFSMGSSPLQKRTDPWKENIRNQPNKETTNKSYLLPY